MNTEHLNTLTAIENFPGSAVNDKFSKVENIRLPYTVSNGKLVKTENKYISHAKSQSNEMLNDDDYADPRILNDNADPENEYDNAEFENEYDNADPDNSYDNTVSAEHSNTPLDCPELKPPLVCGSINDQVDDEYLVPRKHTADESIMHENDMYLRRKI